MPTHSIAKSEKVFQLGNMKNFGGRTFLLETFKEITYIGERWGEEEDTQVKIDKIKFNWTFECVFDTLCLSVSRRRSARGEISI
jgi:hypothetical protein